MMHRRAGQRESPDGRVAATGPAAPRSACRFVPDLPHRGEPPGTWTYRSGAVGVEGVIRRSRGGTGAVEPPPELLDSGRDPAPGCGAGSGEDLRCDRAGDDLHRGAWRWTWV